MTITVAAMTVSDVVVATTPAGLIWRRYDAWQALPTSPGIYFWAGLPTPGSRPAAPTAPPMDDGRAAHAEDVLLYIGKGNPSLRARHRKVWPYDWQDAADTHGHARTIRRHAGVLFAAAVAACPETGCPAGHGAETWERRLLALHLRRTALVPVVNGGAWSRTDARVGQARAWADQAP